MVNDVHQPSTRARSHGDFLRLWESNAPLTDDELQLCARVETQCSSMSKALTPSSISSPTKSTPTDPITSLLPTSTYKGHDGLKGLKDVTTPEEFHVWHDEMGRRLQDANDEKYRTLISSLTEDRKTIMNLQTLVNESMRSIQLIYEGHEYVDGIVSKFKLDCEKMVSDRKKMGELADALRKRLTYFEELETLTIKLSNGRIQPVHHDFVKLLHRLDECVAYASNSTGAVAEADGYLTRFLDLQRRAFTSIRDYTVKVLKETSITVAKELKEERLNGAGFRHADLTDASKEYLRFRTIAPKIKSLMTELKARSSNPLIDNNKNKSRKQSSSATNNSGSGNGMSSRELSSFSAASVALSLYSDCEECFFDERKRLLEPSVAAHIKSLGDVKNMIALARLGSSYVLRVCQLERQLYEHFFPVESVDDNNENESLQGDNNQTLLNALRILCDMVYTELRPQILQEDDLDKLVYLIEVLKTEILGDEIPRRGFAGKAFAPSAIRAIADAQERIIYRAEVYMRDEIRGFIPQSEHLNYPDSILQQQSNNTSASSTPTKKGNITKKEENINNNRRSIGIYKTWYPPVERTLRLLSMLYRCVEGEVFAGVAQEAVAICVQSVGSAAARIASIPDKENAEDHAQLFLVWQLLMTREQISPFDVEMSYTEHELDFFELRSLLGSVIRGKVSARSLASRPTIRERIVDSKRDLDQGVRGACEAFILKTTRTLLDPLLSFLAKCNALPSSSSSSSASISKDEDEDGLIRGSPRSSTPFDSLKRNAGSFAHPKRIKEMWLKIKNGVETDLKVVVERMKIYITKAASRGVLLRPIRANIAEAATELLSVLQLRYSLEERDVIGIDGGHVSKMLDDVDGMMGIGSSSSSTNAK